ncbi:MAG: hypothetical protein AAF799_15255 [Myxococcota bacterium]
MRTQTRQTTAALVGAAWVLGLGLLGCGPGPSTRSLHEVDGQVVASSPPPPVAYEEYLKARLALERDPPQLEEARRSIERALRYDPRDPHLWATHAEIEARAGERERAEASARKALAIRPGYPPAERVLAELSGGSGASAGEAAVQP